MSETQGDETGPATTTVEPATAREDPADTDYPAGKDHFAANVENDSPG